MNTLLGFVIQRPKANHHQRLSPLLHFTPDFFLLIPLLVSPLLLVTPAVVHAQWEPDIRLTFNPDSSYTSSNNARCIAVGPVSYVHVVWCDYRDGNGEIYYKRSTDSGTSWSSDIRLTNDSAISSYPSIEVLDSIVHVVWQVGGPVYGTIYYKRSTDNGFTWSNNLLLSSGLRPSVAATGQLVHIVFHGGTPYSENVFYKRSTDFGVTWDTTVALPRVVPPYQNLYPSVSASGSMVHVVWEYFWIFRPPPVSGVCYLKSTDSGSTWQPYIQFGGNGLSPSVYGDSVNVHVVWYYQSDVIGYSRSTDGGATWSRDTVLIRSIRSRFPNIASSGSNVHLVWTDCRNGYGEIYSKCSFDSGNSWSQDFRLTMDPNVSDFASVAVSGPALHVVWEDNRDGNYEIYYKRNLTGNGVEEHVVPSPISHLPLSVHPNPFTSFTTLPGHEAERFSLYDVSGRRVGTFKGDRVGEGLGPGVYFLKSEGKDANPLRIVKLR